MSFSGKGTSGFWNLAVQKWISVICVVTMMTGVLYSRSLLSISMILLFINAMHPQVVAYCWRQCRQNLFAVCCFLFFICYFISGLWSTDNGAWWDAVRVKLPFLFLPFAFFSIPVTERKYKIILLAGILSVIYSGVVYSICASNYHWAGLPPGVHLKTPMHDDYLRFSMLLLSGIVICFYLLFEKSRKLTLFTKVLLVFWALSVTVYLHVLAAKSGVLFLYIILAVFLACKLYRYKKRYAIIGVALVIVTGTISVVSIPPVRAQLNDMVYEVGIWKHQEKADMDKRKRSYVSRMMSYRIALHLIKSHPVTGVGAGDFDRDMRSDYDLYYPYVPQEHRVIAHNQLLATAAAIGVPLSILFILIAAYPLFYMGNNRLYFILGFIVVSGFMLFEAVLEIQYGVFIFLFFNMLWPGILSGSVVPVMQARRATDPSGYFPGIKLILPDVQHPAQAVRRGR